MLDPVVRWCLALGVLVSATATVPVTAGAVGFGATGKVLTDVGNVDSAASVAVQSDGKVVVAGTAQEFHFGHLAESDFALVRYNEDGTLDDSFGETGRVLTDVGSRDGAASMAVQPDGKILVAGGPEFLVVRYNPDGTLDPSFGGTGKVTTPIGIYSEAASVAAQADGKVVVAGYSWIQGSGSGADFTVARYNPDGTLDPSFGGTGTVVTPIGAEFDSATSVAVQPDGRIIVTGHSHPEDLAVVRYNVDGTLDASFGATGKVTTLIESSYDATYAAAVQADGKIVVAGGASNFSVVRYNPDGTLDPSFGGSGKVTAPIGAGDAPGSLALQADGKILVAASRSVFAGFWQQDFAVARYHENGTLDTSFGGTGRVSTPVGGGPDAVSSVAVRADGKIVVAGTSRQPYSSSNSEFALVRYLENGALDSACADVPAATCLDTWAKASVRITGQPTFFWRPTRESFVVKLLKGPALTQGDFGDPLVADGTSYTMCVYDDAGNLAGGLRVDRAKGQCAGSDCWKRVGATGFSYKDTDASSDGVKQIELLGGQAGESRILVRATNVRARRRSFSTGMVAALRGSSSATLQIFGSNASECFSATLGKVRTNDFGAFNAKK